MNNNPLQIDYAKVADQSKPIWRSSKKAIAIFTVALFLANLIPFPKDIQNGNSQKWLYFGIPFTWGKLMIMTTLVSWSDVDSDVSRIEWTGLCGDLMVLISIHLALVRLFTKSKPPRPTH